MSNILFVPGNFGVQLNNNNTKVWINPFQLAFKGFKRLQLGEYNGINGEKDLLDPRIKLIPGFPIKIMYKEFQIIIRNSGFNLNMFSYDWRKDINYSANLLEDYISRLYDQDNKVTLIGHSEGGTVILAMLAMIKGLQVENLIDKVILLGPSVKGTFAAAFAFDGQVEQIPIFNKLTEGMHFDYVADVLRSFTALYQLLPTDTYIIDFNWWKPMNGELDVKRFMAHADLNLDISNSNMPVHILMGSGISTCNNVKWVTDPHRPGINKLINSNESMDGDGFMLNSNSEIEGANNIKFDGVEHLDLVKNKQVLNKIVEIINL